MLMFVLAGPAVARAQWLTNSIRDSKGTPMFTGTTQVYEP
jgi:hypothetical protein